MGQLGNKYENYVLDSLLGPGFTPPPIVYVALMIQTPTPVSLGLEVWGQTADPSTISYARVAVTNDAVHWPPAINAQKSNAIPIIFPQALSDWGTITSFALFDDSLSGNVICYGDLQVPRPISAGSIAQFTPGSLVITAT